MNTYDIADVTGFSHPSIWKAAERLFPGYESLTDQQCKEIIKTVGNRVRKLHEKKEYRRTKIIGGSIKIKSIFGGVFFCLRDIHGYLAVGESYRLWSRHLLNNVFFRECVDYMMDKEESGRSDAMVLQHYVTFEIVKYAAMFHNGSKSLSLIEIAEPHIDIRSIDEE